MSETNPFIKTLQDQVAQRDHTIDTLKEEIKKLKQTQATLLDNGKEQAKTIEQKNEEIKSLVSDNQKLKNENERLRKSQFMSARVDMDKRKTNSIIIDAIDLTNRIYQSCNMFNRHMLRMVINNPDSNPADIDITGDYSLK